MRRETWENMDLGLVIHSAGCGGVCHIELLRSLGEGCLGGSRPNFTFF